MLWAKCIQLWTLNQTVPSTVDIGFIRPKEARKGLSPNKANLNYNYIRNKNLQYPPNHMKTTYTSAHHFQPHKKLIQLRTNHYYQHLLPHPPLHTHTQYTCPHKPNTHTHTHKNSSKSKKNVTYHNMKCPFKKKKNRHGKYWRKQLPSTLSPEIAQVINSLPRPIKYNEILCYPL